jgi:hypothetical protein
MNDAWLSWGNLGHLCRRGVLIIEWTDLISVGLVHAGVIGVSKL